LEDLRAALQGLRLDTASAVTNIKFEIPAVTFAAGLMAAGHPIVASAAAGAVGLAQLRHSSHARRKDALRPSASYLLRIGAEASGQNHPSRLIHRLAKKIATRPDG
jgi:hypothetical protein